MVIVIDHIDEELNTQEELVISPKKTPLVKPIFSAYEVGRIANSSYSLESMTRGLWKVIYEDTPIRDLYGLYNDFKEVNFLPIQGRSGKVVGYIQRQMFLAALSSSMYSRDLMLRPGTPISTIMDPRVIVMDAYANLSEASTLLMKREDDIRFDPFVITLDGEFFGVSSVRRVLDGLNYYFNQDMGACDTAQRKILQSNLTGVENELSFASIVRPLKGPGGDFTAKYELNEKITLAVLFDVCGKGLKASTMVTTIGSLLRNMVEDVREETSLSSTKLHSMILRLNRLVCELCPEEMYATGVVVFIDKVKSVIALYDFGHGFIWLRRNDRVYHLENPSSNEMQFFGMIENLQIKPSLYRIKKEDLIFACSDGLIEAKGFNKEDFGLKRIQTLLSLTLESNPHRILNTIENALIDFRGNQRVTDDLSMFCISFPLDIV